ncbi:hypothetical protein BO71DRAFT_279666, partial [Aspergillus ellipticus CBS 707.79]
MIASSIIASWADISHALVASGPADATQKSVAVLNAGYFWMLANCVCHASFVLGMRKKIKTIGFKDFDTMLYNNLISIPTLLILTLLAEDWSPANIQLNFPPPTRMHLFAAMLVSGVSSIFISYSSAWCVRVTSSTTYSMVGALNKVPLTISGLVFFDAPVTAGSVSAVCLSVLGGVAYAGAKVRQ